MASREPGEIMFVIGTLLVGGTELHLATVAPALVQAGWRVSLYTLSRAGPLADEMARKGVTILKSPIERGKKRVTLPVRVFGLAVAACHFFYTMMRRRARLVHFFLPASYLVGGPLAVIAGVPIRLMSRRSLNDYQGKRPLLGRMERRFHAFMTLILGNSQRVIDQLRDEEGVAPSKLRLIYNGIDTGRFIADRVAARAALNLAPTTLTLVIVANLIEYKGHADLIEALGLVRTEMPPDWRVLIVGRDDGIGSGLRELAERVGVASNVTFLGERRDTPEILAAGDIGLLCSHEEGFSNAVLEKMASGLPLVVTDVGGNAEAVVQGITGLVVPPRDPSRLGAAIVRLAGDERLRKQYGAAGKARIHEHFTLERCVAAYDRLYRELLGSGPQIR